MKATLEFDMDNEDRNDFEAHLKGPEILKVLEQVQMYVNDKMQEVDLDLNAHRTLEGVNKVIKTYSNEYGVQFVKDWNLHI